MPDIVDRETRSRIMSSVRAKDTGPEMVIRKLIHGMGYRYRLHDKKLPGKPDLVFPSKKKVIFVNGCFWHGHNCAHGRRRPKTNANYWNEKIEKNIVRDKESIRKLQDMGWEVLVIWECEIPHIDNVKDRVKNFLDS